MSHPSRRLPLGGALVCLLVVACSGASSGATPVGSQRPTIARPTAGMTIQPSRSAGSTRPSAGRTPPSSSPRRTGATGEAPAPSTQPAVSPVDTGSPEPQDTGGSTVSGDVPDNAVFLTYDDATHGFSAGYVEGWQVQPQPDGVVIRDKDSSEIVQVVPRQTDPNAYLATTDLPALQARAGFKLVKQEMVPVKGHGDLLHLLYHAPAAPDPVTGKEVPSTIDRYYVLGSGKLAVVTLSTPDGVDNVDAFRQMIESFRWK